METYGVLNKNTNITEYTYVYSRPKSLCFPYDQQQYIQYIIEEGHDKSEYIWNDLNQVVILDANYISPSVDYNKIGYKKVREAREFSSYIINKFAGENIALGITQANKTAEVLSIMEGLVEIDPTLKPGVFISMIGAINSGSLYEALTVIDYHIVKCQDGDYDNVSTFLNESRLTYLRTLIEGFLGI